MAIETVVRNINLAADKPFGVGRFPLQNRIPLLEPVQFTFSKARPEPFRIRARFCAQCFKFRHRLEVRAISKTLRRMKDAFFLLQGFDVGGR